MTDTDRQSQDCYEQLRDLLGNNQDSSSSFKKDTAAGFVVGAGAAAREAVPALNKLGLSPIFILHYDSGEMYNLLNDFLSIDLIGLRTPGMAQRELDDLKEKGIQVILGVSTIASSPPATPREEYVYNISKLLLEQKYNSDSSQTGHLPLPSKRCLADMLNETSKLYMAEEAKERDWKVQSIRSQHVDSETTVNASETEQDSAFWWQFKKKVEVS